MPSPARFAPIIRAVVAAACIENAWTGGTYALFFCDGVVDNLYFFPPLETELPVRFVEFLVF